MPLDLPVYLDQTEAKRLLWESDTDALAALIAAASFLGDELLDDEDGQPPAEQELQLMLGDVRVREENLSQICGLLHAVSGDEFLQDATHFRRMVAAINEGDPFFYEDENEEPTLPDIYWAVYLAGLLVEDDLVSELSPSIRAYIQSLTDDEVEDVEAALQESPLEPGVSEGYISQVLFFRRAKLAADLLALKCQPEWVQDLDPELYESMQRLAQS